MKRFYAALVTIQILFGLNAYAGGVGGNGGPPAREMEGDILGSEKTLLKGGSLVLPIDKVITPIELTGKIKIGDLLRDEDGKILIPLKTDVIRRLKMRASVSGSTTLSTEEGDKFTLQRDAREDKLVDLRKAAEVIEMTEPAQPR